LILPKPAQDTREHQTELFRLERPLRHSRLASNRSAASAVSESSKGPESNGTARRQLQGRMPEPLQIAPEGR